jgi:hypothetical protein
LQRLPGNGHHLLKTSISGILEAFGEAAANSVKRRLAGIGEFAVMADECTDINGHETVSVCIRFIENCGITELFIGCWRVTSTIA